MTSLLDFLRRERKSLITNLNWEPERCNEIKNGETVNGVFRNTEFNKPAYSKEQNAAIEKLCSKFIRI